MMEYLANGTIARFAIGLVLAGTALGKALHFEAAVRGVQNVLFRHKPGAIVRISRLVSTCVIVTEVALAAALLTGFSTRVMALYATLLFLAFGTVLALALVRTGQPVACGCSGSTAKSSWDTVLKNVALAMLSLNAGGILGLVGWALAVTSLAAALSVTTFDAVKKRSGRLTPAARTP